MTGWGKTEPVAGPVRTCLTIDQRLDESRSALGKKPANCTAIEQHGQPEDRLKLFLPRLVAQRLLRQQGPRPAADQCQHVQGVLLDAPLPALRRRFIDGVGDKGNHAGDQIETGKRQRQPAHERGQQQQTAKRGGENNRKRTGLGRPRSNGSTASKPDLVGTKTAVLLQDQLVADEITFSWPPLAVGKCLDMDKGLFAFPIGGDKAKALAIFPAGDFSLVAHGEPIAECVKKKARQPCGGGLNPKLRECWRRPNQYCVFKPNFNTCFQLYLVSIDTAEGQRRAHDAPLSKRLSSISPCDKMEIQY